MLDYSNVRFLKCPECGEVNYSLVKAKHAIYDCDCGCRFWLLDNEVICQED